MSISAKEKNKPSSSEVVEDGKEGIAIDEKKYMRTEWNKGGKKGYKQAKRVTILMRSAERVDRIFGSSWTHNEKFMNKVYPTDMNVPKCATLHPHFYQNNPPITCIGKYATQLNARALKNYGVYPSIIYCSPTLRTIQTAAAMAKCNGAKVCVEPGLLEPLDWYKNAGLKKLPEFMEEGMHGMNIDEGYKPILSMSEMRQQFGVKTQDDCAQRIMFVVKNLCGLDRESVACIVGHAITIDIATKLASQSIPPSMDVDELTSFEDPLYCVDPAGQCSKLELGVRYPPGCIMAVQRLNDGPPYILQTIPDIIPPLTIGKFSNKILKY